VLAAPSRPRNLFSTRHPKRKRKQLAKETTTVRTKKGVKKKKNRPSSLLGSPKRKKGKKDMFDLETDRSSKLNKRGQPTLLLNDHELPRDSAAHARHLQTCRHELTNTDRQRELANHQRQQDFFDMIIISD
jgi:hypothetical protein